MLNNSPEAIMIGIIENFVPSFAMKAHDKFCLITFFKVILAKANKYL
ncbi:MAG: hypothetical protein ACJ705_02480 [Nitrososphaeraceae archaeon]